MKRIIVFNDALVLAGSEILLVSMLNHLASQEHNVTLLLPQPSQHDVLKSQLDKRISIKYLRETQASQLAKVVDENLMIFAPSLYRKLKGLNFNDFDVALCFKETLYSRLFKGISPLRVLWVHTMMYSRQYTVRSMRERLAIALNKRHLELAVAGYKKFDKVVCVSNACRQSYHEVVYDNKPYQQHVEVLFNAIDTQQVVARSTEYKVRLPEAVTNFVCVTRHSADKRVDRMFSAAKRLHDQGYQFHIHIIGSGFDTPHVEAQVKELNIQDSISFLGQLPNPQPYVSAADWTLCVSERESFSLSLLESMSLGTPVITTNCGGPADIVHGGRYGLLVDNSSEGVFQGMKRVLDDATLHQKYSSELPVALERFSYQSWIDGIGKVLELNNDASRT